MLPLSPEDRAIIDRLLASCREADQTKAQRVAAMRAVTGFAGERDGSGEHPLDFEFNRQTGGYEER